MNVQDKRPDRGARTDEKRIHHTDIVADIRTDRNDPTKMTTRNVLCERCERLDYSCWNDSHTYEYKMHLLESLGVMDSWRVKECDLCSFFYRSLPAKNRHRGNMRRVWGLFIFDKTVLPDSAWLKAGTILLCLLPLCGQNIEAIYRDTLPDCLFTFRPKGECTMSLEANMSSIDYKSVKSWLKVCSNTHSGDCFSEKSTLGGLRVIDCFLGDVVPIPVTDEYITLSYVWGTAIATTVTQPSKEDPTSNELPLVLPRTIHDAMVATVNLGHRYLWIDQYCMPQEEEECHKQIQQMDSIYRNSSLTIIAAAGENAHYGLPGVSKVRYCPPSIHIGQSVLASTNCHFDIQGEIESSVWRSRGWTYQEGLLPKRRLIFTDKRVYYECQRMCCETRSKVPPGKLSTRQNIDQKWCTYCDRYDCDHVHMEFDPFSHSTISTDGRRRLFAPNGVGTDSLDVLDRITEYSTRSLSYESDILNGIMGILKTFQNRPISIRHLWGLPFPGFTSSSAISRLNAYSGNHDPVPSFLYSLGWTLDYLSPRRLGFPSWSWTGWYGKVNWQAKRENSPKSFEDETVRVGVELVSGQVFSFEKFQKLYHIMPVSRLSTVLRVKAKVSKIRFDALGDFYFDFAEQKQALVTKVTTTESLLLTDTLLGMYIIRHELIREFKTINMLLIIRDTGAF